MTNELRERVERAIIESNGRLTVAYAKNMIAYKEKDLDSWTNGRLSHLFEARYEIVRLNSDIYSVTKRFSINRTPKLIYAEAYMLLLLMSDFQKILR